ncbi:hypothetical protein ACTA71_004634 [Dictyostelium dimigraforme]
MVIDQDDSVHPKLSVPEKLITLNMKSSPFSTFLDQSYNVESHPVESSVSNQLLDSSLSETSNSVVSTINSGPCTPISTSSNLNSYKLISFIVLLSLGFITSIHLFVSIPSTLFRNSINYSIV